jgi:transposase-like protein
MRALQDKACSNRGCENFGKPGINIGGHGWFTTKSGRRRRHRCKICGRTASTNTGRAYSGLRCTRTEFDQVASLRVDGVSVSATARLTGRSRNTIARWLERASTAAERFNRKVVTDFDILELQADELFTFIGGKSHPSGCLQSSRCRRGCGPAVASVAALIGTPRRCSTTLSCVDASSDYR